MGSAWIVHNADAHFSLMCHGFLVVGLAGFEPTTFRSQSGRATNLRYSP